MFSDGIGDLPAHGVHIDFCGTIIINNGSHKSTGRYACHRVYCQ